MVTHSDHGQFILPIKMSMSNPWNCILPDSPKLLLHILPCLMCRLFHPTPNHARLQTATKFIAWLSLADTITIVDITPPAISPIDDDTLRYLRLSHLRDHSASTPTSWTHCVLSKLERPKNETTTIVLDTSSHQLTRRLVLLDALGELWTEMSSHLTPKASARFVSAVEQHFRAVGLLQGLHSESVHMGVAEYMSICRWSSGVLVGIELLHYMLELDEDPVHLHPLVEELRDLVVDYMCMCNEMVSCRMGMQAAASADGDRFNLPYIVYKTGMVGSFEEAIGKVAQMMEHVDARCMQVVDRIGREHEELMRLDPMVNAYLVALVSCLSSTLSWSVKRVQCHQTDGGEYVS